MVFSAAPKGCRIVATDGRMTSHSREHLRNAMLDAYRGTFLNTGILEIGDHHAASHSRLQGGASLRLLPAPAAVAAEEIVVDDSPKVLDREALWSRFGDLRAQSRISAEAGSLEQALVHAEEACAVADRLADQEAIALSTCNRAAIAIMLGRLDHLADMRNVLMRNFNVTTSFIAAYNLSHAYELKKEFKKALFYARIARDRAEESGRDDYLVNSYNQIGNSLLGDSFFAEAAFEYQRALALMPVESSVSQAAPAANLGYCTVVLGRPRAAFSILFRSLRWLRRRRVRLYEAWFHISLCYCYLEVGRLCRAWRHGKRALEISERTGEFDAIKSALFLLAEVEKEAGDPAAAYEHLADIQKRFYPEGQSSTELISRVEMRSFVNLRA